MVTKAGSHVTRRTALRRTGLGALAPAAVALWACGAPSAQPAAKRTQPVTLDAWSRLTWFKDLIDKYNAGPGKEQLVTVTAAIASSPLDFQNKLLAAAAAGTPPDFTTIELNISPLFNVQRVYDDISKEYSQLKLKDQLPPAMVRYGSYEGKTYQLPFWVDASGLYWNKSLFKGVGLDPEKPPKTWDEMTTVAVKVNRQPEVSGVTIPYNGSPTWMFMPWVYANGGKLLSDDGKKSVVNSEEGAGAFVLWNDLAQKRQVTPEGFRTRTNFDATQLFLQGKLAMYHSGVSFLNQLKKDAPDLAFGTAVLPVGPRGTKTGCSPGGDTMGIPKGSRYRADAWKLLEWLLGNDAQVEHVVANRLGIPILTRQFDNKYYKEEPRFLPFRDAAQAATPTWTTRFEDIKAVMTPEYMAALQGTKEPRAALRDMADAIDRELAKG